MQIWADFLNCNRIMVRYLYLLVFGCFLTVCNAQSTGMLNSTSLGNDDSDTVECRDYHSLKNSSDVCHFVNTTDDCAMDAGFIDYIIFALCNVESRFLPAVYVLFIFWLLYLFIALGTTAESFFCPALEFIAHNLKLSQNIAGITVVAFGNGAPDIFSAVAAFTNSNPSSSGVAIGALLGAGVFVTTVVAGSVTITKSLEPAKRPFLRDVTFYLATVFWTFCLLYKGQIDLFNSIGFLLLYFVYVIVVLLGRYINQKIRTRPNNNEDEKYDEQSPLINNSDDSDPVVLGQTDEAGDWVEQPIRAHHEHELRDPSYVDNGNEDTESENDSVSIEDHEITSRLGRLWSLINPINAREWKNMSKFMKGLTVLQIPIKFLCNITVPVVSAEPDANDWSRTLSCIHCITAPIFCVFAAKGASVKVGVLPLWAFFLIIGSALAIIVFFTSKENRRPKYYWVFAYVGFVASVVWTYCIANEIVNLLQSFGALWDVSNVIMGLTLLAWGNSIGDMVADVTLAKQGYPRMAISACFGGPFFNLIIGIGLPCTIANISTGSPIKVSFTLLEAFLVGSLIFALVFSYLAVPLRNFKMSRAYGIILIIIYAVYLPIVILSGTGVIK